MNTRNNRHLTPNAQVLRREMTREERLLWYGFLRGLPITVNRQKVIGQYIVDFYCAAARLVIELDGSQHYDTADIEADRARDEALSALGLRVLRYANTDVTCRYDEVCADILRHIADRRTKMPSP